MGKQWKQCQTLFFLAPKSLQMVTAAMKLKDAYSLGEKLCHLDSILKSIDIILPTNVCLVKAMVFPVVMYGCESWTVKKAEHWRIDAFVLWCWRRLLRVPWTARRSDQSILKEINPEYSLKGLILKLKLQYFGHLIQRTDSLEKTRAGKDWRQEEQGTTEDEVVGWHHRLNGNEFGKFRELLMDREAWHASVHGVTKSRTQLSHWTELRAVEVYNCKNGIIL